MKEKKESQPNGQLGVRLDPDIKARAEEKAKKEHRTLSDVVRMLLEQWLKKKAA